MTGKEYEPAEYPPPFVLKTVSASLYSGSVANWKPSTVTAGMPAFVRLPVKVTPVGVMEPDETVTRVGGTEDVVKERMEPVVVPEIFTA